MKKEGYITLKRGDFALTRSQSDSYSMDFHIHDDFEIYYNISGGRFYLIENHVYEVEPGDLFVINSNEAHKTVPRGDMPYERYVLTFKPGMVLNYSTEKTDLLACFTNRPQGFSHKITLTDEGREEILELFEKIETCKGFGADIKKISYFVQLLVLINEFCIESQETGLIYDSNFRIKPVLDHLNARLTEKITLEELADEFHINKYYLCDLFKRYTGTSIGKYVAARRIAEAKKLLGRGYPVFEACQLSGFNDYCHFIRTFTKVVGMSPKKYVLSVLEGKQGE